MFKMRCQVCGSTHTKKNGVRKGVQLYKCQYCGYQFRARTEVSEQDLWNEKAGAPPIGTPAHSCRFAQSYSSWSYSPAELHYASDCEAKI